MIRKGSLKLFVVSVVSLAVLSMSTAALASAALTGAGSTVAGAVMPNWTNGFLIREGITATYSATGVEVGLQKLDARQVDFAGVDGPLSPEQAAACNGCAQIPWYLTGVDVAYRLKGVNKLNLSGPVIAAIFNGKITKWNDPKIAALNPKAKLPGTKISVVYPGEASGQSWAFTGFLAKSAGKKTVGTTTAHFKAGTTAAGDRGVGAAIGSTEGAIGYVSASYAGAAGLKVAAIENAAGSFVAPSVESFTAAGATVKSVPASGIVEAVYPAASAGKAYPLATFGYAVVPHAAPQKAYVEQFLNYAVGPGAELGVASEIAGLPKAVKTAARTAIGAL
ncbi:MAG: phosphate ABC transporter substrate-binding protein PstS [Actinobacteria bacterium]|nr:phosphate ABC transporter substrate-binding protein PstS [Actinomycetota bacterium]